ncbi:hypothetical protein PR003_g20574 [Phytophthora rubi]|uniref:Uncharacterized protein n=1 Tax=Phytophthora rubi TaxID=129364 RepID=A0A6A3JWF2_9STRA|nr:hypothetical protein PR001_g19830 [Phytophthora rubi]KAE9309164.1 hypothetical protein PR003_g20574 [Phytophthora rubi]
MRVHTAIWLFAEEKGNRYAQNYAKERKGLKGATLLRRDSEWLLGKGGIRLRNAWKDLSEARRQELLAATPDPSIIGDTFGILDERTKRSKSEPQDSDVADNGRKKQRLESRGPMKAAKSSGAHGQDVPPDDQQFQRARLEYHQVVVKESRVLMQLAYDSGNMDGLLKSLISGVESAIQVARFKKYTTQPKPDFEEVARQVADVFVSVKGMVQFAPEPFQGDDAPSESFAFARMVQAHEKYVTALNHLVGSHESSVDPDPPLFQAHHKFFGRVVGSIHKT